MIEPRTTKLLHAPSKAYVEAQIVGLTPEMIADEVMGNWWTAPDLVESFETEPIDFHWDWGDAVIEFDGRILASEKIAIVAGGEVQGAMRVSIDPVDSIIEPGMPAVFVEWLFTAPRNRPELRADKQPYLLGVGTELLTWAAWFSRSKRFNGRIRLDGSPGFVTWYRKRGLQPLGLEPIVFEGVSYTPMALDAKGAEVLLTGW